MATLRADGYFPMKKTPLSPRGVGPRLQSSVSDLWYFLRCLKGTRKVIPTNSAAISSHIYRMDFDTMLSYHLHKKADITIGMMVVPKRDIHQFGTGIIDADNRIVEWEEKPAMPRTNLASMGIYIFETKYLLPLLARDRQEVDFGIHIIPRAINEDRVYAYPFYGYWRDVGTIQSYWEANMDIIRENSQITPEEWGIYPNPEYSGRSMDRASARFLSGCKVDSSMIASGCVIEGTVINSVLSPGVHVKKGAVVTNSVIFYDSVIEEGALVDLVICDKRVQIGAGAIVGCGDDTTVANKQFPKHLYTGISLVGKGARIPDGARIGRNCIINFGSQESTFSDQLVLDDGESIIM